MPTARLSFFISDVARASDLVGLGQSIRSMTHGVVDASDIYRAALVQSVAALDHYCHGVILDRAVSILLGRIPSGSTTKVGLTFDAVRQILSALTPADQEQAARTHVAQRLGLETFQRSESIASGLAMVGVGKIFSKAFPTDAAQMTIQLNLIVDRRNRIVHQGDSDPLSPGLPTALSDMDALDAVRAVDLIGRKIDQYC